MEYGTNATIIATFPVFRYATHGLHWAKIMVLYRRNYLKGGTYFFTVTLRNRQSSLLIEKIDFLREAIRKTRQEKPFQIDAWVVLPEHTHAIWTLPPNDDDYSGRWRLIKSRFSHQLAKENNLTTNTQGEYQIWQRRFWEHTIRDEKDFSQHVDYIHYNPVKHGYVMQVRDWQYSTFHRYIKQGIYPANWGNNVMEFSDNIGSE